MIEFFSQDGETLCHGFGEVLEVLEGLHDSDLCRKGVGVVLYGQADNFVYPVTNALVLHVGFGLGKVIRRSRETAIAT